MSTVVRDLIGLGTAAVLLTGAIALDHLLRTLLAGAVMPGRGKASSLLPPLIRPPVESRSAGNPPRGRSRVEQICAGRAEISSLRVSYGFEHAFVANAL